MSRKQPKKNKLKNNTKTLHEDSIKVDTSSVKTNVTSPKNKLSWIVAKKWLGLIILSLALAIIILDGTITNVSLKEIAKDLGANLQDLQWSTTLYSLMVASFVITGGRLGDFFGRKKMFLLGAVLFAIGSTITATSHGVGQFIFGRSVFLGLGAALMMPATSSLLVTNFHGKERNIAFGVWGAVAGSAAALGPLVGGWMTTYSSWHNAFLINVGVVALILVCSFLIPQDHKNKETQRQRFDIIGVVLSALGLASLVYGFIEASTYGWWRAKEAWDIFGKTHTLPFDLSVTPVAIVLGLVILAIFIWWEKKVESKNRQPLVSLHLFQNRQYSTGLLVATLVGLGQMGMLFVIPLFFQIVASKDAFHTGLALLPMSITAFFAAPITAALANKFNPKIIILGGLFVTLLGALYLWNGLAVDWQAKDMAPALIALGIGFGALNGPLVSLTLSGIKPDEYGEANGVMGMARQLGPTLGTAIMGTIFLTSFTNTMQTNIDNMQPTDLPYLTTITGQKVQLVDKQKLKDQFKDTKTLFSGENPQSDEPKIDLSQAPVQVQQDIANQFANFTKKLTDEINSAVVKGDKKSMLAAIIFMILTILVATRFKSIHPHGHSVEESATVNH